MEGNDDTYYNRGSSNLCIMSGGPSHGNSENNVFNQGSGDLYLAFAQCLTMVMTHYLYNYGSGDLYVTFGASPSPTPIPCDSTISAQWAKNVHNEGSGDFYIRYRDCGVSRSNGNQYVKNRGSGDIRISYWHDGAQHVVHQVVNAGSGHIYVKYLNGSSNMKRSANLSEETAHIVQNQGSGKVYLMYGNNEVSPDVPRKESIGETVSYNRESTLNTIEDDPSSRQVKKKKASLRDLDGNNSF